MVLFDIILTVFFFVSSMYCTECMRKNKSSVKQNDFYWIECTLTKVTIQKMSEKKSWMKTKKQILRLRKLKLLKKKNRESENWEVGNEKNSGEKTKNIKSEKENIEIEKVIFQGQKRRISKLKMKRRNMSFSKFCNLEISSLNFSTSKFFSSMTKLYIYRLGIFSSFFIFRSRLI